MQEDDGKKRGDAALASDGSKSPLWLGDELEFWPEKSGGKDPVRFVKIAALHSELVAVSSSGHLYQWRWCDMTPFRGDNPSGTFIVNIYRGAQIPNTFGFPMVKS